MGFCVLKDIPPKNVRCILSGYPAWIWESFIRFWKLASRDKDRWIVGLHDKCNKAKAIFPSGSAVCRFHVVLHDEKEAKRTHVVAVSQFSFASPHILPVFGYAQRSSRRGG
jgi:hypothetical protein